MPCFNKAQDVKVGYLLYQIETTFLMDFGDSCCCWICRTFWSVSGCGEITFCTFIASIFKWQFTRHLLLLCSPSCILQLAELFWTLQVEVYSSSFFPFQFRTVSSNVRSIPRVSDHLEWKREDKCYFNLRDYRVWFILKWQMKSVFLSECQVIDGA